MLDPLPLISISCSFIDATKSPLILAFHIIKLNVGYFYSHDRYYGATLDLAVELFMDNCHLNPVVTLFTGHKMHSARAFDELKRKKMPIIWF